MKKHKTGAKILVANIPTWVEFEEISYDDEDFELLGEAFEKEHYVQKYQIGNYECRLINMVELCDFASSWFKNNR